MKLKYYLRGLGIGILTATIILMAAFAMHEPEVSDEQVIQRARELGMVKKDELNANESIPKAADTERTEPDTESLADTEDDTENTEPATESLADTETEQQYVEFTIVEGQLSSTVAKNMEKAGLVDDAWEFNRYLQKMNYDNYIQYGTVKIPVGASYEELGEVLMRRR